MKQQSFAMSICGILGFIFIVLKLTNYIDWSWWLVLLPWYAPIALIACLFIICVIVFGLSGLLLKKTKKVKRWI